MVFAEPFPVVALLELEQREPQLRHRLEGVHPQKLFLQRADESLGHTVALRLSNEGRARSDPEERQSVLKVLARIVTAVIVALREATGRVAKSAAMCYPCTDLKGNVCPAPISSTTEEGRS